ncbi:hypothetical protein [Vibrio sonorensis]|uniref:hypothetical protein n=1 Tax=Vibrio sonorensis TaxID=1004316 RepID=UPI0011141DB0|nr:hypothetical protein [Vibrio sonorensis]
MQLLAIVFGRHDIIDAVEVVMFTVVGLLDITIGGRHEFGLRMQAVYEAFTVLLSHLPDAWVCSHHLSASGVERVRTQFELATGRCHVWVPPRSSRWD